MLTFPAAIVFCRQASRNAAKFTEDGRFDDKRAGQLPAFEQARTVWPSDCRPARHVMPDNLGTCRAIEHRLLMEYQTPTSCSGLMGSARH